MANALFDACELRAILFADAYSFSRLVLEDERQTIGALQEQLERLGERVAASGGEVVKLMGDSLVALFPNAHDAVETAVAFQSAVASGAYGQGPIYRIGIHLGDVLRLNHDISGHAVNIAARLQTSADPGTVLVSETVRQSLQGTPGLLFSYSGSPYLKNIGDSLKTYTVTAATASPRRAWHVLSLVGPFRLAAPNGEAIALPDPAKALLLAIVVAGRTGAVGEAWIRDLLFEDSAPEDRDRQLDAALSAVANAFAAARSSPVVRHDGALALDPSLVDCDLLHLDDARTGEGGRLDRELCEGFAWGGARFRGWLTRQRSLVRSGTVLRISETLFGDQDLSGHAKPRLFCIGLVASTESTAPGDRFHADVMADLLVRSLIETEALHVIDLRHPTPVGAEAALAAPDLLVQCDASASGGMVRVTATASRTEDRLVLRNESLVADQSVFQSHHSNELAVFVSRVTDGILSALVSGHHIRDEAAHLAAKTALRAVHHLLTLSDTGLDKLEADLARAYEFDRKPLYLAWLAYLTTFAVGERHSDRDPVLQDRARELARRAREAGGQNGTVLGLLGHVHSYVLRDFAAADDCLSLALETSPFRAICWDSASLLCSYTGRNEEALVAAQNARRIGRYGPYRHLFEAACTVASFTNGRFEDAIRAGENVHSVQPAFKANLRYLAAAYGLSRDRRRGEPLLQRLCELEPDLSQSRVVDGGYPVPSRETATLIARGLGNLGLRAN